MKKALEVAALLLPLLVGCASRQNFMEKVMLLEANHSVVVKIDADARNAETSRMIDRIEAQLAVCPEYFKSNIGTICISASGFAPLVIGYVNPDEAGWPIHLKSRSLIEKILVWSDDKNTFLHEASHSFEMRMGETRYEQWLQFYNEFAGGKNEKVNISAMLAQIVVPFAGSIKPKGYASLYACTNHFEDFAETHCFLRRNDIEKLKSKDIVLYNKCKAVERLTNGDFAFD